MEVRNKKLELDELFARRREILSRWPTAQVLDIEDGIHYRKGLPDCKKLGYVLDRARQEKKTLICVHAGHALVPDTIEHFKAVQEAGADLVNLVTDTYSRRGRYAEAEKALNASFEKGKSLMNGFPIVNHGLEAARCIRESTDIPIINVDSESEHAELLTEFGLAAGFEHTSADVEAMLRTAKDFPLEQRMKEAQYQNRLAAYYGEHGAPVVVCSIAHLSGLDSPGMKVALSVLHNLMVAEQGVKDICTDIRLNAQLLQDVAALRVLKDLAKEYLDKSGYEVRLGTWCVQYAGVWPRDESSALSVCCLNSAIAILGGVDWFVVKSPSEGIAIPTAEANVVAVKLAKQLIESIGCDRLEENEELRLEKKMCQLEARAIISKTLEMGDGDPAVGQIRALDAGIIDVPFSPYRRAKGDVFCIRDDNGAVRYLKWGNVPLPQEVIEYHQECIAKRKEREDKELFQMMIDDVYYLAGDLLRKQS